MSQCGSLTSGVLTLGKLGKQCTLSPVLELIVYINAYRACSETNSLTLAQHFLNLFDH